MPSSNKESIEKVDPQIAEPENVISEAPVPQSEMKLHTPSPEDQNKLNPRSSSSQSSDDSDFQSVSEVGSGFAREQNECTEFCIELFSCFGLCETCCPSSGEGCLTTCATIFGNILVGCCKC